MPMSYPFSTQGSPELSEVGGKALSLIRMTQAGLPVPPGLGLMVEFFQLWPKRMWVTAKSTPLFINAGGILLEVGGLLQHGALVAREYGKPCVAGIEGVTAHLKDGQMVEVDGTHGVVRMVGV